MPNTDVDRADTDCTRCGSQHELEQRLLEAVMDTSTDGVLIVDVDGQVVAANRRFQELWGISDELMATRADGALLAHVMSKLADPDGFVREVTRLYASTEESHDTVHFRDGRVFDRVSRAVMVDGRNGRLWSFRDQTPRHERDKLYRAIVNLTGTCIDLLDVGSLRFVEANDAACRALGYTREEYLSLSLADLHDGYDANLIQTQLAVLRQSGSNQRIETRLRRKDGTVLDVELDVRLVNTHGREFTVGIWRDITTERAERMARENDAERRRVLIEHARDGIAVFDQSHRIIEANQTFADMLGYSREEVLQLHTWDFEDNMTEAEIRAAFADVSKINEIIVTRHRRKDGTAYDAEVALAGAQLDGQNVVITATRDVSEQRHFQAALEAREKVFAAIAAQAVDGIVLIDCDTRRFVEFNEAACAQAGYTRAEFALLTIADVTTMAAPEIDATFARILETGVLEFEVRHRRKDGTWLEVFASNRRVEVMGRPYIAAIWRDITEQKKSLDALRLSEERQRLAVQAGQVGLWDLDLATGVADVNDIYATMIDEDPAIFRETHAAWLGRMHPDDRGRVKASFTDYIEGRSKAYSVEFRARTSDGSWRWILSQGRIVQRDGAGKPARMLGSHTNIDARKRMEERLQESEFFLRQSQQIGLYGGWRANTRENTVMWTDGVYSILKLPLDYKPDFETGLNYYVPESRARVVRNLKRTLDSGVPFSIEVQVRTHPGELRWTELRGFPHFASDGTIDYVMGTLQDITERKLVDLELQQHRLRLEDLVSERTAALEAANHRLSQSDVRLNAMFDMSQRAGQLSEAELLRHGINEAARLTDSAIGYLHFVNDDQETLRLVTWSDDTLAHCTAAHDDHYPVSKAGIWADTVRLGVPVLHNDYQAAEGRKGYPAGHAHLVRHLGVPVVDGGKVRMLLGVGNKKTDYDGSDVRELHLIGHDLWRIYQRRRTELQLAEAKETAEAASRAKSTFLANMSHEIRTPLNAITGFAHLVRQSGVTAEQALQLDQVDAAGAHLLEVINQVLDLAKIEAGRFVLDEAQVDVPGIVANVAAMVQSAAHRKGIALVSEVEALPDDCIGDPTRLRQALLNYATNAAKFTQTGRIVIRVRVVEKRTDSVSLRFEVEDTGIGIEPGTLSRLFVEFEQADNSTTRQHRGTGLGLAITRRIAMLMGGDAGASSTPGAGSLFWFTAVLQRGMPPATAASRATEPSAKDTVRSEFGGSRVLVVEDDPVNQTIMTMLLRGAGLETDVAGDGREAVRKACAGGYALILMDMQLPLLDGPAATRQIRATDGLRRVPIIAMTANAFVEDRAECFAAGMDDFITKPVNPALLLGTLLQWLRHG